MDRLIKAQGLPVPETLGYSVQIASARAAAQVIPGLLQYGDVPEIASLIAPRPCLWEVGRAG